MNQSASIASMRALATYALPLLLTVACNRTDQPRPDTTAVAVTTPPPRDVVTGPAGAIHVDDGGSGGVPVLFVHSFGGDASHWKTTLQHLRPTRRAIAMELRAHGQSTAPANADYSVDGFSSDIAAVADSLGLQRFVLVGHSLGGAAAALYAGAHPDRVAGLVLVGTPGPTPPDASKPIIAALESNQYQKTMDDYMKQLLTNAQPAVATEVAAEFKKISREQSLAIIKSTFAYDPTTALHTYKGPILSITADAEKETPLSIHRLKPNIQHQVISGTSHWIHMDKPDEFNTLLDTFLQKIQP